MRLMSWNINGVATTAQNAALKYGSWKGFFDAFELDVVCLQVWYGQSDGIERESSNLKTCKKIV